MNVGKCSGACCIQFYEVLRREDVARVLAVFGVHVGDVDGIHEVATVRRVMFLGCIDATR